jgi:hypothetical protein
MNKDQVLNAINGLFSDASRSPRDTLEDLKQIVEEVEIMIDALESDLSRGVHS